MDLIKVKGKKGLISKTWERCKCFGGKTNPSAARNRHAWPGDEVDQKGSRVAPEGCFSVYVGAQKQRFVIRTECLNHPLFRMLLEEAESEYGYSSHGPLELPCDVDLFVKVLVEMDCDEIRPRCSSSSSKTFGSYNLLPSPRLLALNEA